jgi:hypothetical protein
VLPALCRENADEALVPPLPAAHCCWSCLFFLFCFLVWGFFGKLLVVFAGEPTEPMHGATEGSYPSEALDSLREAGMHAKRSCAQPAGAQAAQGGIATSSSSNIICMGSQGASHGNSMIDNLQRHGLSLVTAALRCNGAQT